MIRKLIVLSLATVMLLSSTMTVSAATLRDIFDAEYYAASYGDLKAAFGDNEEALYQHYLDYGLKEGRNASAYFNVQKYRENYEDLNNAFGDDWSRYAEHYLTFGLTEARDGGGEFDAVSYAKRYPDLYEAYGYDIAKLSEHYEVFGAAENRIAESQAVVEEKEAAAEAARREEEECEQSSGNGSAGGSVGEFEEDGIRVVVTYDANGNPVRAEYYVVDSGEWFMTESFEYDAAGNVVKMTYDYPDGTQEIYYAEYDDQGRFIKSTLNGQTVREVIYTESGRTEYDYEDGAIDGMTVYEGDVRVAYTSYKDGLVNSEHYYDAATGQRTKWIAYREGVKIQEWYYNENGTNKQIVHFTTEGVKTTEWFYDENGVTLKCVEYYTNGKVSRERIFVDGVENSCVAYTEAGEKSYESYYNEKGQEIKYVHYEDGVLDYSCETSYNEAGRRSKRVDKDANGTVTGYFEYTYEEGYVISKYYNGAGEFQYENRYEDNAQ